MPAQKRITDKAVMEAIQRWRGNVSAAAEQVGMAPVNLRKRLDSLGVDLSFLRSGERYRMADTQRNVPSGTDTHQTERHPSGRQKLEPQATDIFPAAVGGAKFRGVQTAESETPVKEVRHRKPIRITPDHQEQLRQAKLDYAGRLRIETDETAILAAFIDAKLAEFLTEQLGPEQAPPKRKPKAVGNGE